MLKNQRGYKSLRTVAKEIDGVSSITLSRIERGGIPDVNTFIRICKWLGVPTDNFIVGSSKKRIVSTREIVIAHLRADRELSKETVTMLITMVDMAYNSK